MKCNEMKEVVRMICRDITRKLDELAPPSLAMSWDNPGLLAGDPDAPVSRVFLALDASSEAVDAAAKAGCQMLITHHPLIFTPLRSVRTDHFIGRRIFQMIRSGVNYYAMHTNFDISVMGKLCMERLGIPYEQPLETTCEDPSLGALGIGAVGTLPQPMSAQTFARRVREVFSLPPIRVFGAPDKEISKVAICPGSGKGMASWALLKGADVLVTGDVDHHSGIDGVEEGLCIIDAGHHGMEHVFTEYMQQWFAKVFPGIEVVTDANHSPFTVL